MTRSIPELARSAERLRFRIAWHQGGDRARLVALRAELLERAPFHPLALNFRAREALPETFLGPPPPELAELGAAWLRDDLEGVLREARAIEHPRARLVLKQLGEDVELAGDTVDVLAAMGKPIDALAANPLYGTAQILAAQTAEARGEPLFRIPLLAPVRRVEGRLELPTNISDRACSAWSAWNRAVSGPLNDELPPGSAGHRALLEAWRAGEDAAPGFREDPNLEIRRLDRLERARLLEAYEWSCGLNVSNAGAFRTWAAKNPKALRRLWTEGLRKLS